MYYIQAPERKALIPRGLGVDPCAEGRFNGVARCTAAAARGGLASLPLPSVAHVFAMCPSVATSMGGYARKMHCDALTLIRLPSPFGTGVAECHVRSASYMKASSQTRMAISRQTYMTAFAELHSFLPGP